MMEERKVQKSNPVLLSYLRIEALVKSEILKFFKITSSVWFAHCKPLPDLYEKEFTDFMYNEHHYPQ